MKEMKQYPIPRERIYDLYWYFASERHRIFERRAAGESAPWTQDQILQDFKFCNVFRAVDRVSQYLIRSVAYQKEPCSTEDRAFQIVAFRLFSRIETWERLGEFLGHSPTLHDLANGTFVRALGYAKERNRKLYTGAFILAAADAYGMSAKHLNHAELLRHMFLGNRFGMRVAAARALRDVYDMVHEYPLMGDFMSYQIAVDLNYSEIIEFSEDDFTQAGPGALRGIQKVFVSIGDYSPEEVIRWMVDRQESEFKRLRLPFGGLCGRRLHAIDCQGLFCEVDKYCRVAVPELQSARRKIKARFLASDQPIDWFFPPKWEVDAQLLKRPRIEDEERRDVSNKEAPHQIPMWGQQT